MFNDQTKILIIEDETLFAKAVGKRLTKAGYDCELAATLGQGRQFFRTFAPDLILLDMRLPDGSGMDFLSELNEIPQMDTSILVFSAYGELEDAVSAMKLNAADYLKKPIDLDELLLNVEKLLVNKVVSQKLEYSRERERHAGDNVQFLGEDSDIQVIRQQVERMGKLCSNPEIEPPTILILGETGTGKDVCARLIHASSARASKPFVQVDCASLPKDLIESELFGHEKGAFTNAHSARTGLIEAAEDGVLFLDEIGELSLELQAKLLAMLERRTVRRIGSSKERPIPAWFIAATNRNLEEMVQQGEFRSDLYFRLNVLTISTPPLYNRGKDIQLLAEYFIQQTAKRYGLGDMTLGNDAAIALMAYSWPGNVRELKHLIERAVLLSGDKEIGVSALMLPSESGSSVSPDSSMSFDNMTLDEVERMLIVNALSRTNDNVSEAARQLGVTRMAMRYRMQKYEL